MNSQQANPMMAEKQPIKPENLKDKCAIITGGASGIGLATATKFAEYGAYVTIADINDGDGERVVSELGAKGLKVKFVKVDVTDWQSALGAFKQAVEFCPRKTLDVACLFAGISGGAVNLAQEVARVDPEPSLDRDPVEPNLRLLDINLIGVFLCAKLALHYFRLPAAGEEPSASSEKKSLILMSSLAGYMDVKSTAYGTSKFGVRGLFRSLRLVSKSEKSYFTVNLLAPGFVATPLVLVPPAGTRQSDKLFQILDEHKMWVPIEHVVDASLLCATNREVDGRGFAIWPHGFVDTMDDIEMGWGAPSVLEHGRKSGYYGMFS